MNSFIERLIATFGYESYGALGKSLAPSFKYDSIKVFSLVLSSIAVTPVKFLGMSGFAFAALLIVMVTELVSGVMASRVRKEEFSSMKLSRFTFKVFQYLVIIAVTYLFSQSFEARGKELAATIFDWMHIFLVVQIVQENVVSILENGAVISGKPKTHWISKLTSKINSFFS